MAGHWGKLEGTWGAGLKDGVFLSVSRVEMTKDGMSPRALP